MITFRQFLSEGTLAKSNLNKNPDRLEKFIKKLENKEPFVLKDKTTPTLVIEPDLFWLKDLQLSRQLKSDYILDINGQKIPLSTLQKTKEFGSTGRTGTEKETIQLNRLDELIKELGDGNPIDIKVGEKIYKNCIGVKNTPGTPKSDFEILDKNNQSVIFISHKDGTRPNEFGQWSGMTHFLNYPEINTFVNDVRQKVGKEMPRGTTFSRPIEDENLKNKACFGKDFDTTKFGINNVTCIIQGQVKLTKKGNFYILEGDKMWLNGDTPSEKYTPSLMAIYKGQSRNDFQIFGARFSIYPESGRRHIPI